MLRLALVLALTLTAAPLAQDAPEADSAAVDTLASGADSLSGARFVQADSLGRPVLSDSARAALDSAAVAALEDTTATLDPVALGEGVPVTLFGGALFEIWGPLGSLSAEERAARLSARLEALARNRDLDPAGLRVVDGQELAAIELGDLIVMSVTDDDAEGMGMARQRAAEVYAREIREGIERYREAATIQGFIRSALISVGLFVLLLLALRGLRHAYAWLDRRTADARGRLVRPIHIGSMEVIGREDVSRAGRALGRLARLAVSLVVVYFFLTTVFGLF
ncbi:MAG: hypothetical protein AAFQ43_13775, partial [Bacteroidota bacterium]